MEKRQQRSAGSASDDWKVVDADPEEKKEEVAQRWVKLLKKYWGIKRLQWIYHGTGTYLNELVSKDCKKRLSATYRIQK